MTELTLEDFKQTLLTNRVISAQDTAIEWIPLGSLDVKVYVFHYPVGQVKETHTHQETRLTFIRSGRIQFTLEGETTEVGPGGFIACHPNVPHSLRVIGNEPLHLVELVLR
jgi:quercetin dioxygenase-like cupin family protein